VTENFDWSDLEIQLQETRESLDAVEHRLHQVRREFHEKQELQTQQEHIRAQIQEIADAQPPKKNNSRNSKVRRNSHSRRSPLNPLQESLHQQLQEISDRLEQIELDLESRLISWSSFNEIFWQIVRFVGIGIIIGVILKSCAG
jgi:multidrug resistance efflux pump